MRPPVVALAALVLASQAPRLQLETRGCVRPGSRARVCAQAEDEHAVARVRAVFRAAGTVEYWATEMAFDGTRYCAWLPRPLARTKAVDYYVEAFDVDVEISRTRVETIGTRADCADVPGAASAAPTVVAATAPDQRSLPPGFDPATVVARGATSVASPRR